MNGTTESCYETNSARMAALNTIANQEDGTHFTINRKYAQYTKLGHGVTINIHRMINHKSL